MSKTPVPKGKVKGGTRFPKHDLAACYPWAEKLVSKTHGGSQPKDLILAGVVETKGPHGEVKIAALKQFGLLEGDAKGYSASALARQVVNAPPEEKQPLLRMAALTPAAFQTVFDTFQGDSTSLAKIRQRFTDLKVHPDSAEKAVEIYTGTFSFAGLGTATGDQFVHVEAADLADKGEIPDTPAEGLKNTESCDQSGEAPPSGPMIKSSGNAVIHVNVTIDSSMDAEKLEKQLLLLRKYGAL